jgi:maspardin
MEGTVEYANFRAWVPRNVLSVGTLNPRDWIYYDWGPRSFDEPLLCLHPVLGSAESFYLQTLALAERGYRVISPQLPVYWSTAEFCDGLHCFLDSLNVRRVHLYGAGLGGFLALQFSARRPERVVSVALTHAFLSTSSVDHSVSYSPSVLRWLPDFLVRSAIRSLCPTGPAPVQIAEAAEFVIRTTLVASRDELASRLTLMVTESTVVGRLRLPEERMSWIDSFDFASTNGASMTEEAKKITPDARRALLKSGGDFPYLGSADEVSMHLVVHLRRNAASPAKPLPLPPPARARAVPSRRRRGYTSPVSSDNDDHSAAESPADMTARAEQMVTEAEAENAELYSAQVALVRTFLPDRDEDFILAIVVDCEGDADAAVSKARDGQYSKRFYEKTRRKAVRKTVREIRKAALEGENAQSKEVEGNSCGAAISSLSVPAEDAGAASAAIEAVAAGIQSEEVASRSASVAPPAVQGDGNSGLNSATTSSLNNLTEGTPASRYAVLGDTMGSLSTGLMLSDKISAQSQEKDTSAAEGSNGKDPRAASSSRSRTSRWKSLDRYPSETDSVAAYVTSERVGMRSDTKLIGRGPVPLSSSTGSVRGAKVSAPAPPRGEGSSHSAAVDLSGAPPLHGAVGQLKPCAVAPHEGELEAPSVLSVDKAPELARFEADDVWGEFRRQGLDSLEHNNSFGSVRSPSPASSSANPPVNSDASDEAARLREWVMSARTATESAQRRGI